MDNLGHRGTSSAIVEVLVVHHDWRGMGMGKKMMDFAVRECRKRKCYKISLSSNLQREIAHRFYESLGFKRHGYSCYIDLQEEGVKQ